MQLAHILFLTWLLSSSFVFLLLPIFFFFVSNRCKMQSPFTLNALSSILLSICISNFVKKGEKKKRMKWKRNGLRILECDYHSVSGGCNNNYSVYYGKARCHLKSIEIPLQQQYFSWLNEETTTRSATLKCFGCFVESRKCLKYFVCCICHFGNFF